MKDTKLYAVVDKGGMYVSKPLGSEYSAWLDCLSICLNIHSDSYVNEQIGIAKRIGYHCIELHTYNPATQVVVEKRPYDLLAYALNKGTINIDGVQVVNGVRVSFDTISKFLSAGKE